MDESAGMQRRRLLATLGTAAVLLSGCLARQDDPAGSPADDTTTGATSTAGTSPTTDGTAATDGDRRLTVSRVETFTYALRINDLGESPAGSIPAVADLDDRVRTVVEAALSGGYETDDPAGWLVEFVSGTRFVRGEEGRFYRLAHTLPRHTITAEPKSEDEVSGEVASPEAYEEAVTHDGVVMTGLARLAMRDGGVELVDVWPALQEFLESYDAVRYRGDLLALSETVDDPGPPYTVTAEAASLDEVAGRDVWNAETADPAVQAVLREAGRTEGVYRLDESPAGLLEGLDAHDRLYLDGRFFTTYVENRDSLPVSLTATAPDPSLADGGATLRLAVRNEGDREIALSAGAPRPFGVLHYHPVGAPGRERLLWTDAYEESQHVYVEDGSISRVEDLAFEVAVGPGDEVFQTFTVGRRGLPAGEYVVEDDLGVEIRDDGGSGEAGDGGGTFPYRVVFRVE